MTLCFSHSIKRFGLPCKGWEHFGWTEICSGGSAGFFSGVSRPTLPGSPDRSGVILLEAMFASSSMGFYRKPLRLKRILSSAIFFRNFLRSWDICHKVNTIQSDFSFFFLSLHVTQIGLRNCCYNHLVLAKHEKIRQAQIVRLGPSVRVPTIREQAMLPTFPVPLCVGDWLASGTTRQDVLRAGIESGALVQLGRLTPEFIPWHCSKRMVAYCYPRLRIF